MRKIRYDYYNVLSASCHQFGAIVRPSFNKTDVGVQMPMIFSYDCVFGGRTIHVRNWDITPKTPLIAKDYGRKCPLLEKAGFILPGKRDQNRVSNELFSHLQ